MSAIEYENGNVRDEYKDVAKNYYIYEQAIHVDLSLDKGDPISVIIDNDHRIWVMLKNGEAMNLVVEGTGENICDHYYFKFSIGFKCTASILDIIFFGIMLPKIDEDVTDIYSNNLTTYTIITSNWMELNKLKKFSIGNIRL